MGADGKRRGGAERRHSRERVFDLGECGAGTEQGAGRRDNQQWSHRKTPRSAAADAQHVVQCFVQLLLKRFRLSDGGKWLARPASSIKYEFIRSVPIQGAGRQLQLHDLNRELSFLNLSLIEPPIAEFAFRRIGGSTVGADHASRY